MEKDLFYRLVEAYKKSPTEFQATAYWQAYEQRIFKEIEELDINYIRSGKYEVFKTFGFNEVVYPGGKDSRIIKALNKVLTRTLGNTMPYGITIHDIRTMAFRHCQLYGRLTGSKPIESLSASDFGNPKDFFHVKGNSYSIWFLNYYLRYCFVNQHFPLKGNEIIVELGSGSGHQVEVLKKIYPDLTILCFDLPAQIFLAEAYLSNVLPKERIVSVKDCMNWEDLSKLKKGCVHFFGNWQFPLLKNFQFELFWNAASFGEMEPAVVRNYLSIMGQNYSHIFLSQARKGKESEGANHVMRPITFEDYDQFLEGYELIAEEEAFQAHKRMHFSGGYFNAVWRKKVS